MSRANETSGAADAAAGGSTEHETSGHGASTLGSRTPDSQTFITALDHSELELPPWTAPLGR